MSVEASRLAAVLCLGSAAVTAQVNAAPENWTLVRSEPTIAYYLNKETVQMQGGYLAYWILVNFSYDPQFDRAQPYKSARLLRYADCATREQDTKSLLQYHAPMGRGEPTWVLTFDDDTIRMQATEPGGVGAQILDIACSLKR